MKKNSKIKNSISIIFLSIGLSAILITSEIFVFYNVIPKAIPKVIEYFFEKRFQNTEYCPRAQINSIWCTEDENIYFTNKKFGMFGELFLENSQCHISVKFGPGRSNIASFKNYDKIIEANFISDPSFELFCGETKYFKDKCIIKITYSYLDNIDVGDKITFYKTDTLPDWADTDFDYESYLPQ